MTEQTMISPPRQTPPPPPPAPPEKSGGNNRMLLIGGLAAVALLVVIIIAAVLIVPRLLGGGGDSLADVMPVDTTILVEANVANLLTDDAVRVGAELEDAFDAAEIDYNSDEPESLLEVLDEEMDDMLGLTITDDILPWIGTNLAVGILELDMEAVDEGETPDIIVAATVRDNDAADAFIEDLVDAYEDEMDYDFGDDEYEGVLIFEDEDNELAFGRSDNIFFLAPSQNAIEDAIDAQNGENLTDNEVYSSFVGDLPNDRAVTVYIDGQQLEDLVAAGGDVARELEDIDPDVIEDLGLQAMALTLAVVPEGIRMDSIVKVEEYSDEQQALIDAQSDDANTIALLPDSTYMYIVANGLNLYWESVLDSLDSAGLPMDDVDEAMDQFDDQFGFNPADDLIPLLDGEFSIALVDSDEGMAAQEFGADLGLIAILASSDMEEMGGIVEDFTDALGDQGLEVNDSEEDDYVLYEVEAFGELAAAYATTEDYFIAGTGPEAIEDLFGDDDKLTDNDFYKYAMGALENNTIPVMFLNLGELLSLAEDIDPSVEEVNDVNPVTAVVAGARTDDTTTITSIVFVVGDGE
jgi:hypothetical protein